MIAQAFRRGVESGGSALAGLPFVGCALVPLAWAGQSATLYGLAMALLALFTAYLPLLAIASGGMPQDPDADLPLTSRGYAVLLAGWTVTDLLCVLIAG